MTRAEPTRCAQSSTSVVGKRLPSSQVLGHSAGGILSPGGESWDENGASVVESESGERLGLHDTGGAPGSIFKLPNSCL